MIEEIISDSRNGNRPKVSEENLKLNEQPTHNVEIGEIPQEAVPEVFHETPTLPEGEPEKELAKEPKTEKVLAKGRIALFLLGLLLVGGLGFLVWQRSSAPKAEKPSRSGKLQITPVTVATVTQKTVPIQLQAIGNVQSGSTVSVTAQVSGRVTGVYFKKGQEVKKGQLLFSIDDRSQTASIQQAQRRCNKPHQILLKTKELSNKLERRLTKIEALSSKPKRPFLKTKEPSSKPESPLLKTKEPSSKPE
jgi:biotin carboxyl carrier protein